MPLRSRRGFDTNRYFFSFAALFARARAHVLLAVDATRYDDARRLVVQLFRIVALGEGMRKSNEVSWRHVLATSSARAWRPFVDVVRAMCDAGVWKMKNSSQSVLFTMAPWLRAIAPRLLDVDTAAWQMIERVHVGGPHHTLAERRFSRLSLPQRRLVLAAARRSRHFALTVRVLGALALAGAGAVLYKRQLRGSLTVRSLFLLLRAYVPSAEALRDALTSLFHMRIVQTRRSGTNLNFSTTAFIADRTPPAWTRVAARVPYCETCDDEDESVFECHFCRASFHFLCNWRFVDEVR
jgi:hypothetical protein